MMAAPVLLFAQEIAPAPAQSPAPTPARPLRLPGTAFTSAPAQVQPAAKPAGRPNLPDEAPPAAPVPSPQTLGGDGQPSAASSGEALVNIDFPNTEIGDVLDYYGRLTGKKVLRDTTVNGKIQVRVVNPVTTSEAIRILETVFSLNGFTLIPGPGDIVKAVNQNKNVRQFSIPIVSEPDQLPASNQVVTYMYKLDYADPAEVKSALLEVISPTPNVTNVVALPKSQAVLITEGADMIRSILPVLAKLDTKPAEVVSAFFTLQRADAKEVVEKLSKMFEKPAGSTGSTPGTPGRPQPPGQQPGQEGGGSASVTLSEDSLIVGKIKIEADLRTNRIHVITRPVNLPFLRTLISELDSEQPLGTPATRPLRFVRAKDILDIVAGAVAEPGVEPKPIGGGVSPGAAQSVNNSRSNLGSSSSRRSYSNNDSLGSSSGGDSSADFEDMKAEDPPEGVLLRNAKIIADNRVNAIVVVGSDEMKQKVFNLLDQIDVRSPQVMLSAVIGELTLNGDEQFGVDYLLHSGRLGSSGTGGLGLPVTVAGIDRLTGQSLNNVISVSSLASSGGGISGIAGLGNSLDVIVKALESTGRFRVTSRPMIFTSNNHPAVIRSGEKIAIPDNIVSGYSTGTNLTTQSNIKYMDIDLKLTVLPLINSDGEVTLRIKQVADNQSGSSEVSGNTVPIITTRSIDTTVSVANEATIILGGLVSAQKQVNHNGIPVLYRLPVVGPLFGYKSTTTKRTELVVLIRPTVTRNPVEAVKATEKTLEKTNFKPDLDATLDPPATRVKPGVQRYLPGAELRPEE